jgi:fructose-1,6-bisphosphatase I
MTTLIEFINEKQHDFPFATGELTRLLHDIGIAAKIVHREINLAGLTQNMGYEGGENIQGERQKKLDVFANRHFIKALQTGSQVCAIASEENEKIVVFDNPYSKVGKYVVAMDPLDGSSNIEVNIPVGTIFSIYRRKTNQGEPATEEDLLQPGKEIVAAGYILYGSSTMLVYSTGNGVNGFTYDNSVGLFLLSNPNIKIPENGKIYSINEANYIYFPEGIKKYIKYCQVDDPTTNRPYTSRYVGSLVSDFHRNLLVGGIYMYPGNLKNPTGKLRLLYECAPIAFLAEQAGGRASDGFHNIMDVKPETIHQRSSFIVGSEKMVNTVEQSMNQYSQDFKKILEEEEGIIVV